MEPIIKILQAFWVNIDSSMVTYYPAYKPEAETSMAVYQNFVQCPTFSSYLVFEGDVLWHLKQ